MVAPDQAIRPDLLEVTARYLAPAVKVRRVASLEELSHGEVALTLEGRARGQSPSDGPSRLALASSGWRDWVWLVCGLLVATRTGLWLLPRQAPALARPHLAALPELAHAALGWALGWSLLTLIGGLLAAAGVPLNVLTSLLVWAVMLAFARWRSASPTAPAHDSVVQPSGWPTRLWVSALAVTVAAFAATVWKVLLAPLWSWDHLAIWGFKSRLLPSSGALDLLAEVPTAAPHYPLGVPGATALLLGGGEVSPLAVKLLHLSMCFAVIVLAWRAVRLLGGSERAAVFAAMVVALLPLCWSTEMLGTAELPVAQTLLLAANLMVATAGARSRYLLALVVGSLAFSKDEGLVLVLVFLGLSLVLAIWARRRVLGALPSALTLLLAVTARLSLPLRSVGTSFVDGNWRERLSVRLDAAPDVLLPAATELLRPETFGIWLVGVAAGFAAVVGRRHLEALLLLWMLLQLSGYVAVYFVTYLEPAAHIDSSLARIASALEPVVVVAGVALLGSFAKSSAAADNGPSAGAV